MTGKLQAKIAGIPLLSKVPAHWSVNTIKRGFEVTLGKMLQPEKKLDTEVFAPYLRSVNVRWGSVDVSDVQMMWFSPNELQQLNLNNGDLVVCEGGDAGRASIWRDELESCSFQNSVNRVRSAGGNDPRYLMYWLASIKESGYVEIVCNKATIAHLTKDKLSNLPMPYPPPKEQFAIAAYLDAETARIDALVSAKKDLLASVGEMLRGTFFHELSSFSSGKKGGYPSTWSRCKFKHIVMSFDQGVSPQCEARVPEDGEWGVLKAGCINSGNLDILESKALPPEIPPVPEVTVKSGDLIISRANTQSLVGRCAVARVDLPKLMLSDKLYRVKLDRNRCIPEFVRELLWLPNARGRIEERATGASQSMVNIDRRTILEIDLVIPPFDTQQEILNRTELATNKARSLLSHVEREIELLLTLRASTITDAVLGRIDVQKHARH